MPHLGTPNSPISVDDSEDEVYYELSATKKTPPLSYVERPELTHPPIETLPMLRERKRKRASSINSQDLPVAGPSRETRDRRSHPSLVNRLSQPESKKARKRRRKAERQALEEARIQKLSWLNNERPITPLTFPWPTAEKYVFDLTQSFLDPLANAPLNDLETLQYPYPDDPALYDPHSQGINRNWVSSMAMAAGDPNGPRTNLPLVSNRSPLSSQKSLPSVLPPPIRMSFPPVNVLRSHSTTSSRPVDHRGLPPKPPPPEPLQLIGMQPDHDPNSRHGIFRITASTKDVGSDMKRVGPDYLPNPARTLVMEQLPKGHRQPEFINKWSRTAIGAIPIHLFIDGPAAKALIEFSTAELARKAWCSPRMRSSTTGLKSHQLKGKPRLDLIKVWWYRVVGIGAGAGVGEIEEGEIEGDAVDKDIENSKTETKKEKRARLAKEREEKKRVREAELKATNHDNKPLSVSPSQPSHFPPSFPLKAVNLGQLSSLNGHSQQILQSHQPFPTPPDPDFFSKTLNRSLSPNLPLIDRSAYGTSKQNVVDHDDQDSIASSVASTSQIKLESLSTKSVPISNVVQEDDLSDYVDMDVDMDDIPPSPSSIPPPPLHSSLPPRPSTAVTAHPLANPTSMPPSTSLHQHASLSILSTVPQAINLSPLTLASAPQPQHLLPPIVPQPKLAQSFVTQDSLVSAIPFSTPSASSPSPSINSSSNTPVPSEPKAMKNAPTQPSFTKRYLIARQKELEEKITKGRLELAATTAKSNPVISTPSTQSPIGKPSIDLGEKQAMEDRLRKLVLESQRARGKPAGKSQSKAPSPVPTPPEEDSVSTEDAVSSQSFTLEDLAVSFISQTIETIKSNPPAVMPSNSMQTGLSNADIKLELAAKQKRLEQHISETKFLMDKLSQKCSKEERERLLQIIRQKNRDFEEQNQQPSSEFSQSSSSATSVVNKTQSISSQQFRITRWPASQCDSGVLVLSESENEDDEDDGP